MEPISPELVLVDPELAARVRASPVQRAARYPPHATLVRARTAELTPRRPVSAQRPARTHAPAGHSRAFKRLGGSLLGISLMVSGFLVASAVSGNHSEQTGVALPELEATPPAPRVVSGGHSVRTFDRQRPASVASKRARPVAKPRRRPDSTAKRRSAAAAKRRNQALARTAAARESSAAVERKLLSVIVQSPAGKLPPALIDRRTGLAKNNLQAVCTRSSDSRSFLCVVKSALQPEAGPVYAYYRPTQRGRGSFTWYRSRSG